MPILEIKKVSKTYHNQEKPVLQDINLKIYDGEFITLCGESGSGKSTLLRILALVDPHFSGELYWKHKRINPLNEDALDTYRSQDSSIIFQDFNLISRHTIYRNLEFALVVQKVPFAKRKAAIKQALLDVNLPLSILNRYPHQISGGQCQRVAIARSLLSPASILFADEPTGSLDDANAHDIIQLFLKLPLTVVIATHDSRIATLSNRNIMINEGKIHVR